MSCFRQLRAGFVQAGSVTFDEVGGGLAGAEGSYEFLFDAGDRSIKHGLVFGAEGLHLMGHQQFVIIDGFVRVETAEFLPMKGKRVGGNAFRVVEEVPVEGAFQRIEVDNRVQVRQQELAPA